MTRYFWTLLFLLGVLLLTAAVWVYSAVQSVSEIERRGKADLALASDRLVGSLLGYRQLTVSLASDPRLIGADHGANEIADILSKTADLSGALDFVLLEVDRSFVSSASGEAPGSWLNRPFIERALGGALGRDTMVSDDLDHRVFAYAAPVYSQSGPVERILVAILDLEAIEADFRGSNPAVFMTDGTGTIYFSNRSELILHSRNPGLSDTIGSAENIGQGLKFRPYQVLGFDLWSMSEGRYLPSRALHIERDLPVIGMHAEALIDLRPAIATAWLQATAAGAIMLLMGSAIFLTANQRRILAQANETLEARVANRTRELSQVNTALRAEVSERKDAQKALQRAQDDLVQAEKLSALGKMSAGISHELNQPLMAIQSFAENSAVFLERGNIEAAAQNNSKVSDLARRMARIIKNFRAFARQEHEAMNRVDLVAIVRSSIDISLPRLEREGIELDLRLPSEPVWVQGGEVRLQQVLLNLISNASDAMAASSPKIISVSIAEGKAVTLAVSDTGPGIEAPDRVFEPFYSTKEIGEAEGVGLGLSISYGLVQSFGGNIRGINKPDGGALFTVELNAWSEEAAA